MCVPPQDVIRVQRALVAQVANLPPQAPAVQATTDTVLALILTLAHLPPDWTGTLQIPFRHGGIGRIEKLVPVSYDAGLDKP